MANVLLVNPWVCDFKLYDEWMHPLGLYFLADLLKHAGHTPHFLNLLAQEENNPEHFNTGTFHAEIISPKPYPYTTLKRRYKRYGLQPEAVLRIPTTMPEPDCICVTSSMTYWIDGLIDTCNFLHTKYPKVPLILGGISAALIPEYLAQQIPYAHIRSTALLSATSTELPGVGNIDHANWQPSLVAGFSLSNNMVHGPVLLSLGCPLRCSYCASNILQPDFRTRDISTIVNEMLCLCKKGVRDLAFYDDALLHYQENLRLCINQLTEHGYSPRYHLPNGLHSRLLSPEIAHFFKQHNFATIRLGYESGNPAFAGDTSGKSNMQTLKTAVVNLLDAGYRGSEIGVYCMGGLIGQTPRMMIDEIEFIASLGVRVQPVFISPVPKTRLFNDLSKTVPEIITDPRWHNDTFFITRLADWNNDAIEEIRLLAKSCNRALV